MFLCTRKSVKTFKSVGCCGMVSPWIIHQLQCRETRTVPQSALTSQEEVWMCKALQLPNLSIPSQLYKPSLLDAKTVSRKHNDDHHPYFLPSKLLHERWAMRLCEHFVQDEMFENKGAKRNHLSIFITCPLWYFATDNMTSTFSFTRQWTLFLNFTITKMQLRCSFGSTDLKADVYIFPYFSMLHLII